MLDCQADQLRDLKTRVVVPLVPPATLSTPLIRLNPILFVAGERYMMLTQALLAVALSDLGPVVASLSDDDLAIGNALDMLLTGF